MGINTFWKTRSSSTKLLSMGWFIDIHSRLSIWFAKCYRCGCSILTSTNCKIYFNAFYVLRVYGIQITWYINIFHHIKPFLTLCSLWLLVRFIYPKLLALSFSTLPEAFGNYPTISTLFKNCSQYASSFNLRFFTQV